MNKFKVHEEEVEKIQGPGHWGKPLVWKETIDTDTAFEVGVSGYDATDFPDTKTHKDEEAIYIISGEGVIKIGEQEIEFKEGDCLYIPANTPHCIKKKPGTGELKAVYCHSGNIKEE